MNATRTVHIALPMIGEEERRAVLEPLESGWLTQGPKVAEFERMFAERHRVSTALATTSCTTATHLALVAAGIGPGDEVIVPAFTWVSTANVVVHCGATPVFCDVRTSDFNIDPAQIAEKVTDRTKAIIPVHLFGMVADMDAVKAALPEHVIVIEDAACAAGAAYKGTPAGGLGHMGAFSFHPRKSVTTGEGGMLTTNDDRLGEIADRLRNHGASISEEQRHHGPKPYILPEFDLCGFNYRMTDLQGAVGVEQLKKLDGFIAERDRRAAWFAEQLADIEWLRTPEVPNWASHAWQSYVTYVEPERAPMPRNAMMDRLKELGVATRPGTHAVHMLGYYRENFGTHPDQFPGARDSDANSMAIPLHNRMGSDDYDYVVEALHSIGA
ncbi:DegT/DnrJ/EryC1/StrS family aminotransferase [Tsuneonella troitsensis]|uniref:DegT/DnrJ/EryC1/StrS family aminotransferase n=1 Tax=Tsuneonella troitsensis TaxID=292222 RepID=UPI00070E0D2D|nr:DegT/DnrJ/EryC1/StrS family aminotransferase [Tsuneonella troitsensis]